MKRKISQLFQKKTVNEKIGKKTRIHNVKYKLKDALVIIILIIVCAFGILQRMEILAIISLGAIGAIVYKGMTRLFLATLRMVLSKTTGAKIGDVEMGVGHSRFDNYMALDDQSGWVKILLGTTSPYGVGILLLMYRSDGKIKVSKHYDFNYPLKYLINCGLIELDAPTIEDASEAILTPLGTDVCERLLSHVIVQGGGSKGRN